ncbi:MAG: DUF4249 domain-containing protein [Muribaculaceae bacterium]|nr:DUF4249 domain-containing protein [Muribaculaceae bacterium]
MKIKSYIYSLGVLFTVAVMLSSCEKELDFHYHDVEPQLVIEANLTQEGTTVLLTETAPMGEAMNTTPVVDATVTLTDITAGSTRALPLRDDGTFGDNIAGITGHEYRMEVMRGDKKYSSVCTMRQPTEITALEFEWIKMPYDYVAILQVSLTDPDTADDCYWIRLLRNGEPYMWNVTADMYTVDGIINHIIMTSRKDTDEEDEDKVLFDGDTVTAIVSPISHDMFDYIVALETDSNGPCMWEGDFCLGYFLASPAATATIVFRPDEMKEYK